MKILAIETSCDDTAVALIEEKAGRFKIIQSLISSQISLHRKYGGVYPMLAKREHQKNLPLLFRKIKGGFDLIAVTSGPGLEPCLWTGINFAKELAKKFKKPIISTNHVKSHIFVNVLNRKPLTKKDFPAVCLIVSGGHTILFLMKELGKYEILGQTQDDAAGECFDKTARILGLSYPGGPEIAKRAKKGNIILPRPMINSKDYNFSFSGLKTAVLYKTKNEKKLTNEFINSMCFEIQQSIIDILIKKTIKAAKDYKVKTIILGGGVVSNDELRKQMKERTKDFNLLIPEKEFCTDNAVMTAISGFFRFKRIKKSESNIKAVANLKI